MKTIGVLGGMSQTATAEYLSIAQSVRQREARRLELGGAGDQLGQFRLHRAIRAQRSLARGWRISRHQGAGTAAIGRGFSSLRFEHHATA